MSKDNKADVAGLDPPGPLPRPRPTARPASGTAKVTDAATPGAANGAGGHTSALPLPLRGEPGALPSSSDAPDGPRLPRPRRPVTDSADASDVSADAGTPAGIDETGQSSRALTLSELTDTRSGPVEALVRLAYRLGVPGNVLSDPFRKPGPPRLLGVVESPLPGERAGGVALRAGHLLVNGVKAPVAQLDMGPAARLTPPFEQVVHGFGWLRDLSSSAPRAQCLPPTQRMLAAWLAANPEIGKGPAWQVELAGRRLLNWLVHAPLLLGGDDEELRAATLAQMDATARWLDRQAAREQDGLAAAYAWGAVTAAGLLMAGGWARRLHGEAGLLRALGELVSEDGGVLSRSPLAQMDAIALLIDLRACYEAVDQPVLPALERMLALLVPPLLTLRHADGGLGSWQGGGAVSAARLDALLGASGVRARPARDARSWGYQRIAAGRAVLQFDAAPPPRPRHARFACASTLAIELSSGEHRLFVNCGGAALAGGLTPARIEQGLRGTAAHSTLTLDEANSTAVLINGAVGKGVEEVDIARTTVAQGGRHATRLEASHDGYAARYGLVHRRILILRDDGEELRGEDLLEPAGRRGKRGKIGFALRFHLHPDVRAELSGDGHGASLVLPDGAYWQLRFGAVPGDGGLELEESLWVDGGGRPHASQQLVFSGLAQRSGGRFAWLLKKMG